MTSRMDIAPAAGALRPASWQEALSMRADVPDARPICGGTDLMVEINFDRARPAQLLDLSRVPEIKTWDLVDGGRTVRLGAAVPYTVIVEQLSAHLPGLAAAARTVGSPQIRNAGTVGGNLATASPAGDSHPPLLAARATVEVESVRGSRSIAIDDFFIGPKRNALAPDELIRAVHIPVATGPRHYSKIGPRNAMVIATASFALSVDRDTGVIGTGIGSAGPTPLRAVEAEHAVGELVAAGGNVSEDDLHVFGMLVSRAASPIDDVRGTADYRRHALYVLGRRLLGWAIQDMRSAA